jgi:hypothetical protein
MKSDLKIGIRTRFNSYSTHISKLLIDLLLKSSLRITLLISPSGLIKSLFLRRRRSLNGARIDINTPRLTDRHHINLLGLNNKDRIRKRLLALPTRQFIRKDLDLDTKHTLTKKDVTRSLINEITNLIPH